MVFGLEAGDLAGRFSGRRNRPGAGRWGRGRQERTARQGGYVEGASNQSHLHRHPFQDRIQRANYLRHNSYIPPKKHLCICNGIEDDYSDCGIL